MKKYGAIRLLGDWKEQEQDLQFIADLQQAQKKEGPKVKGGLKDGGMYGEKGSKEFKTVGVGFNKMHSVIEDITMNRGVSRFVRFAGQNIVFEVLGAVKFSVAIYTLFVCQYVGEHGDSSNANLDFT